MTCPWYDDRPAVWQNGAVFVRHRDTSHRIAVGDDDEDLRGDLAQRIARRIHVVVALRPEPGIGAQRHLLRTGRSMGLRPLVPTGVPEGSGDRLEMAGETRIVIERGLCLRGFGVPVLAGTRGT